MGYVRLSELGEFGLLAELERRGLARGIENDAAELAGGLVVTQDALVEGVHFRLDWISWRDLGWRAAAVNLSDLAASGATPDGLLVSLAVPPEAALAGVLELYEGIAETGRLPRGRLARWREDARAIHDFVERRCWSDELSSYVRSADSTELDASLLLGALMAYPSDRDPRMTRTIDAVRQELGDGALLYRYKGGDGLRGEEGAFLCCSFWLVDALARAGRLDEASDAMQELIGLANDVGLYAEEIDRDGGEFLGNFPQGLVHLALINAAISMTRGERG